MINIELRAVGLELTPAIKSYADDKVGQLAKFSNTSTGDPLAQVELSKVTAHHKSGEVFSVSIKLHLNGKNFFTEETGEDLYAAIDTAKDELARQITSASDKNQTLFRRGSRKIKDFLRFGR